MEISETALSVFLFTSDNAMAESNGCLNNRAIQNCQTITQICAFFIFIYSGDEISIWFLRGNHSVQFYVCEAFWEFLYILCTT